MRPVPDQFSRELGIEVLDVRPGYAKVRAVPSRDHCNFNGMVHGGYIFSVADVAFAYASNAGGKMALALDMYISFRQKVAPGEEITAEAREVHRSGRTGLYRMTVNGPQGLVAEIQATVYFLDREPANSGCQ